jgi:hypothetical protein
MEAQEPRQNPEDVTPSPPSSALSEPSPARCAAHPSVETYLRCGRCETPICPRCMVMTPVGARCRNCAQLKKLPMFEVRPVHYVRGLAAGVAASAVGAALLALVPGLGFFGFLLMLGLGYAVGEATTAATNRKRGSGLAVVAALAVPFGLVLGRALLLLAVSGGRADAGSAFVSAAVGLVVPFWDLLLLLVAMAMAANRVR